MDFYYPLKTFKLLFYLITAAREDDMFHGAAARPASYQRNVLLFTIIEAANACAFIAGNWMFFWLRVMTFGQLGVVDAVSFAFGLLMEIPTGAIADLAGKRATMLAAMACNAVGFAIMAVSNSLGELILGFWIAQIGGAFYSGASQALLYDSLKADNRETQFDHVLSRINSLITVVLIASVLVGGIMYRVDERLPHIAWSLAFVVGMVASIFIMEPPTTAPAFSVRTYLRQLGEGFQQLAVPVLRPYLLPIFLTSGAAFMFRMGLITPTMALGFGIDVDGQAVLWGLLLLASLVGTWFAPALRRRIGDPRALAIAAALVAVGYLAGALPLGIIAGGGLMLLIRLGDGFVGVISATVLNENIPSQTRATTLSTVSLFVRIPYVVTAPLAGVMAENGTFGIFCGVVGGVLLATAAGFAWQSRRQNPQPAQA
jgi:MFS family permease